MKITRNSASGPPSVYPTAPAPLRDSNRDVGAPGVSPGGQSSARDQATLSDESRRRARALDAVRATPEVRSSPVQQLRAAIADGTYQIDDAHLATSLMRHGAV